MGINKIMAITVCDNVMITGQSVITKDITTPGIYSGAFAAEPDRDWKRRVARFRRLDKLSERLQAIESMLRKEN